MMMDLGCVRGSGDEGDKRMGRGCCEDSQRREEGGEVVFRGRESP